ncbi:MAG: HK97 family phage prohead protease [Pseudomonadota bacterium]
MGRIAKIEGYAAIYGVPDRSGDVVAPGAFSSALRCPAEVRMLYQHAVDAPIGRWVGFEERRKGLYAFGEIDLVGPRLDEIHGLLLSGAVDGLSVGYRTRRASRRAGGRVIRAAELWEVSVVTFPMAPAARVLRVGPKDAARDPGRAGALEAIREATATLGLEALASIRG